MKNILKKESFWLIFLTLLGFVFWFFILSYRFFAFLFWGYVLIRCTYLLLGKLRQKKPRLGKILFRVFTLCLCVVLTFALITEILVFSASGGDSSPESEYVLVLGAGVHGTVPSRSLAQRLQTALDYLNTYPDAVCIVSGGQGGGEDMTEALCMFNWLTEKGIDPQRIWQEDKATSTMENIQFTLDLIEEKTGTRPSSMAVISSEYHLYRASLMAQRQGVSMLGCPAKTTPFPLRLHYTFRELFALWYFWIFN